MSLKALNEDYQLELAQKSSSKSTHGAFGKLRMNHAGGIFSREYPDTRKLEELLLSFE